MTIRFRSVETQKTAITDSENHADESRYSKTFIWLQLIVKLTINWLFCALEIPRHFTIDEIGIIFSRGESARNNIFRQLKVEIICKRSIPACMAWFEITIEHKKQKKNNNWLCRAQQVAAVNTSTDGILTQCNCFELTGNLNISSIRDSGDFPFFGRTKIKISFNSEHEYNNFSISTCNGTNYDVRTCFSLLSKSISAYFSHKTTSSSDENGFPFVELLHRS